VRVGIIVILIAFVWASFWFGGAAMTTETGFWNSATWALVAIAAAGLIPFACGLYLFFRALRRPNSAP
jgi:hypothetical protein